MDMGTLRGIVTAVAARRCSSGWWSGRRARRAARSSTPLARLPLEEDARGRRAGRMTRRTASSSSCSRSRTSLALPVAAVVDAPLAAARQSTTEHTTGHVWDEDLREFNNPLPRWWLWLFIITVVFGVVYLALYPGLGTYARHARLDFARRARGATPRLNAAAHREDAGAVRGARRRASWRTIRRRSTSAATCSSTTAPPATAPTAAARRASPTSTDKDWLWGGDADTVRRDHCRRPHGRDAALGRSARRAAASRTCSTYVLSLQRPQARRPATRAPGKREVRASCARPAMAPTAGQPAARRAESHRRHLAARRRARGGARDHRRRAATAPCRRTARASARRASNYWRPTCCRWAGRQRQAVGSAGDADDSPPPADAAATRRAAAHGRHRLELVPRGRARHDAVFRVPRSAARSRRRRPAAVVDHALHVYAVGFFFFWLVGAGRPRRCAGQLARPDRA